jgi:hypothetical protein
LSFDRKGGSVSNKERYAKEEKGAFIGRKKEKTREGSTEEEPSLRKHKKTVHYLYRTKTKNDFLGE